MEKSTWYHTPTKTFGHYTALDSSPHVELKVASATKDQGADRVTTVTVRNPSKSLAFGVHLKVKKGRMEKRCCRFVGGQLLPAAAGRNSPGSGHLRGKRDGALHAKGRSGGLEVALRPRRLFLQWRTENSLRCSGVSMPARCSSPSITSATAPGCDSSATASLKGVPGSSRRKARSMTFET